MSAESRGKYGSGVVTGLVLGLVIAAIVAVATGFFEDDPGGAMEEAREVIDENYFEAVPDERLEESSIRGMVDELRKRYDDRFSHYFSPDQLDDFNASTSGRFSGIGLTVNEVKRGLRVAAVLPETPAEAAGIEEGDLIVGVNGKPIAGVPADVSTARIKGPPGTEVDLRVVSAESGKARELTVERASVRVPAVQGAIRRSAGRKIAYVRFATFSEGAHGELRDQIDRLYRRGAEGLILDLRGNGGGLLNEAVLSSSVFVDEGVIVTTKSRTQGERDYEAVGDDALEPRPMVVLVNRDSASAAEILAAALEEHEIAAVVGTRTYGKGTFQEVIPIPSGGALDLTIGEYLTADGSSILGEGVKPEVRAEDDPETEGTDEALDRALEVVGRELARQSAQ